VDATPLGPFITEPVPGGEAGVPPEGLCDGAVITRIIGNIGDEGNAISETVEEFKLPTKPPEALGGDDYNGKFIEFRVSCPNGEEQVIDPVVIEELPFEATGTTGQVFTVTSQLYARTIIYIEEPFEIIEDTTTISTCFDQEISNCIFASVGSNSSVSSSGAQAGALFTFARPDGSGNSFNICSTSSAFSPIPPAKARRYIAVYGLSITGSVDGLLLQQTNFSLKNQLDQEADNWVANPTF
jgi:hypothetical protein